MKKLLCLAFVGFALSACESSAADEGNWIQLAKGKQANYEIDIGAIDAEPSLNARTVKLRVTPLGSYVREDKIAVSKFIEYGIVLCDQKRYIMTGQDHFDMDGKFIDANTGTAFYRATGKVGDLVTHIVSVACVIPIPGTSKNWIDV